MRAHAGLYTATLAAFVAELPPQAPRCPDPQARVHTHNRWPVLSRLLCC
jgi:hypothetical protein